MIFSNLNKEGDIIIIKNTKVNLTQKSYERIRDKILNNIIKPGELINETSIAKELGMSRTPVRESIRMLESEGIVETKNGIGTIVKIISFREMKDIFEVRKCLETIAIKTSILNISKLEVEELLDEYLDIKERFKKGIVVEKEFAEIDMKVHNLIIGRCKNEYVKTLFESINLMVKLYQFVLYFNMESSKESIVQHINILNLIKEGNVDELSIALRDHLDWSLEWYLKDYK